LTELVGEFEVWRGPTRQWKAANAIIRRLYGCLMAANYE
jgi:hypothetical protein